MVGAVVDMWLLGEASEMVISPYSTFGFMAHGRTSIVCCFSVVFASWFFFWSIPAPPLTPPPSSFPFTGPPPRHQDKPLLAAAHKPTVLPVLVWDDSAAMLAEFHVQYRDDEPAQLYDITTQPRTQFHRMLGLGTE